MNLRRLLIFVLCLGFLSGFCGNIEDFFKKNGGEILALGAHPLTELARHDISVHEDEVLIHLYYKDETHTALRIKRLGGFFTQLEVQEDNDILFKPFSAITLSKEIAETVVVKMKRWITPTSNSNKQKVVTEKDIKMQLEALAKKKINEADGKDLTLLWLNYSWINY